MARAAIKYLLQGMEGRREVEWEGGTEVARKMEGRKEGREGRNKEGSAVVRKGGRVGGKKEGNQG